MFIVYVNVHMSYIQRGKGRFMFIVYVNVHVREVKQYEGLAC